MPPLTNSPNHAGSDTGIEADFTTEQVAEVKCGRCSAVFPSGTKLKWIHSKPEASFKQPGRLVCDDCYQYYLSKGSTRRRTVSALPGPSTSSMLQTSLPSHTEVRHQVAAAQRTDGAYPMVPIGSQLQHRSFHSAAAALQQAQRHGPSPSQYYASGGQMSGSGCAAWGQVNVAPIPNPFMQRPFPPMRNQTLINPGYQEAHQFYNEMRQYYARQAYVPSNTEVVVVRARMATLLEGKKMPIQISDILEAISNIPVHIGLSDLRWVVYHTLLPHYVKWSKGFPLNPEECTIRDKLWVELVPKEPDVDAIAAKFFIVGKGKNKNNLRPTFSPRNGIDLFFCIDHTKYQAILNHLSDLEEVYYRESQPSGHSRGISSRSSSNKQRTKGKRKQRDEDDTNTNPKKFALPQHMPEPNVFAISKPSSEEVIRALQSQLPIKNRNMRSLFETVIIPVMFFKPPTSPSFTDLVKSPNLLRELQNYPPIEVNVSYRPSSKPQEGAFKVAYLGHVSIPLFGAAAVDVCIKQTFVRSPEDAKKSKIILQGQTQAKNLTMELNCLGWAHALMDLVYAFIRRKEAILGKPDFAIPQMRFVQAGLAIPKDENPANVFLLEEAIDSGSPSWFTKYLNNSSAKPVKFKDSNKLLRAQFLSFSQHVQFVETEGLAFISDFQGGPTLLTDPQIITNL
ncbi:hypothetical protein BDN70DRAFT_810773 [Pholiota conissans]|uniref:Alpha-type protein kinase domain-containing protein n=1 Tax=Pholiota conissans TaxID=109636 RepID=A0A9P5YXC8_9AGAR|nr:hypothetical protein BDN70DRAFT_810773 [Pholiota conissans]